MLWGGIGAVVGFLTSLLGSLVGILVAGFIGVSCGKKAAEADSGLMSGAVAAPAFVIGASAGALVAARAIGSPRIAATLSEVLGTQVSSEEAWQLFLLSIVVAAVFQAVVLILASTAAGAWSTKKQG
jgi:hypothetical protein